jgi:cation:H+ antiporter
MPTDIALIIGGLALLVWGASRFVAGASAAARNLGVAPVLIGLTIVAFGTSAPEILVSLVAAIRDSPGIAIGNAVGSNIANIGLVLGIAALLRPMRVHSELLRRELPMLLAASVLCLLLLLDQRLDRLDGVVLLAGMVMLLGWFVRTGLRAAALAPAAAAIVPGAPPPDIPEMTMPRAITWLVVGLAALLGGAQAVVIGAQALAQGLGVPDLVVGLTVVAIGTSLPELAVTAVAALRNEHDLAVGNIIGSNLFNLLAVIGVAGAVRPGALEAEVLTLHLPVMLALTVALFLMAYNWRRGGGGRVSRPEGTALLVAFLVYHGGILSELA